MLKGHICMELSVCGLVCNHMQIRLLYSTFYDRTDMIFQSAMIE